MISKFNPHKHDVTKCTSSECPNCMLAEGWEEGRKFGLEKAAQICDEEAQGHRDAIHRNSIGSFMHVAAYEIASNKIRDLKKP